MRLFARIALVSVFFGFIGSAQAELLFNHLREDSTLPEACHQMHMSNFKGQFRTIMMGTVGARKAGFSHEYPLKRETARELWAAGQELAAGRVVDDATLSRIQRDKNGMRDLEIIEKNFRPMGFDFHSEGEVLELLGLVSLRSEYPAEEYFHTGGIAYHKANDGTVIGELDIVIGRRSDCQVVVVGEAKLGNAASHAKDQMKRFRQFVSSGGASYGVDWAPKNPLSPLFDSALSSPQDEGL